MFETLTTEVLLSLTTASVSGLAVGGIALALNATRQKQDPVDTGAVVSRAPYNRLHNVVNVSTD